MMNKYAGVTLDWYDDKGATLKAKFPTVDALPDVIKEAGIRPKEKLAHEDFALVAVDEGHVMRKYACHDPGTTAMSVIYFMEHGDKLPEGAQKLAAVNLTKACYDHGLEPPPVLAKLAILNPGTVSGALAGGPGRRFEGAAHGTVGGLLGGAAGGALGGMAGMGLGALARSPGMGGLLGGGLGALYGSWRGGRAMGRLARPPEAAAPAPAPKTAAITRYDHLPPLATASPGERLPVDAGLLSGALGGSFAGGYLGRRLGGIPGALLGGMGGGLSGGAGGLLAGQEIRRLRHGGPEKEKSSGVIDITGQRPKPKVKTAQPKNDSDYAVVLPDGSRHYPIDSWDLVKKAEVYFSEEGLRMQPEIRRQFAVKLAAKARAIGYPLEGEIVEAGSTSYAAPGHLKAAVEMRKIACAPGGPREWLDELFEKHASLEPGVYVECLRRFDVEQGLDRGWDRVVLDPWASTFGINKTAEVVWESGAERVTDEALHELATNFGDDLKDQFTEDFVNEFQKDPVALFNSMPDPQKKILSRMANDSASYGASEQWGTKSPTGRLEGHKKAL